MISGVITVAGMKYAAGLYWQPSPDAKNIAKSAKAAAKQPGFQADFYCIRQPSKSQPIGQFGLGIESAGHKDGMPSIAGCLVGQQVGSWAGAFRVPEGVYFIVVREDLIDPEGDILYPDENSAQARLEQEISRGGLIDILCPLEWGIRGSQNQQIAALLAGNKSVTLNRASISLKILFQFIALFVLLGLVYAAYSWYEADLARQQAEAQAQAEALAKMEMQKKALKEYPRTWEEKPNPLDFIYACQAAMEQVQPRYLGWMLSDIECNELAANFKWARAGKGNAVIPVDGKATVDSTFTTATFSVPTQKLSPRGPQTLAYYGLVDQYVAQNSIPASLVPLPDDVLPPPPDKDIPPPPPPKWRKRSISYIIAGSPWLNPNLFDSIPGLILTSVKAQGNLASFTVEGIVYENKEP